MWLKLKWSTVRFFPTSRHEIKLARTQWRVVRYSLRATDKRRRIFSISFVQWQTALRSIHLSLCQVLVLRLSWTGGVQLSKQSQSKTDFFTWSKNRRPSFRCAGNRNHHIEVPSGVNIQRSPISSEDQSRHSRSEEERRSLRCLCFAPWSHHYGSPFQLRQNVWLPQIILSSKWLL